MGLNVHNHCNDFFRNGFITCINTNLDARRGNRKMRNMFPHIAEKCLNIVFAQLLGKFWHVGPLYAYEIEKWDRHIRLYSYMRSDSLKLNIGLLLMQKAIFSPLLETQKFLSWPCILKNFRVIICQKISPVKFPVRSYIFCNVTSFVSKFSYTPC